LIAIDMPIVTATPAPEGASEAATEAAPATAWIRDESVAVIVRLAPWRVWSESSSTKALTRVAMRLLVKTAAPLTATPAELPPARPRAATGRHDRRPRRSGQGHASPASGSRSAGGLT
jgi:hypothetical protein